MTLLRRLGGLVTLALVAGCGRTAAAEPIEAPPVSPATKDSSPAEARQPRRPWSLVVSVGQSWGGNPDEIEASMRAAGLDQSFNWGSTSVSGLLTTQWGSREVSLTLGRAIRPWLEIRVQATHGSEIDWTNMGYHGPRDDIFAGVDFSTETKLHPLAAALISVSAGPLRVGIGPSLTRVEIQAWSPAEPFWSKTESRVGLVAEAGVALPLGQHLLLDLSLQRHWAGSEEIGPYPLHDLSGQLSTTFPATRVSFDHTSFKLGLGVLW